MTEPDVTLTDYGLTVLCSWFAWCLARTPTQDTQFRKLWIIFFASIAAASLTGGTVHGFFLDETSWGYRLLWPLTFLAIGITAACAWVLTGLIAFKKIERVKKWIYFAIITFFIYAVTVLFFFQSFLVVILNYLPAMVALLIASTIEYKKTHKKVFLQISCGLIVSFVAAYIQQAKIALHPEFFNHNSTYHLVQAIGLFIIFKAVQRVTHERAKP